MYLSAVCASCTAWKSRNFRHIPHWIQNYSFLGWRSNQAWFCHPRSSWRYCSRNQCMPLLSSRTRQWPLRFPWLPSPAPAHSQTQSMYARTSAQKAQQTPSFHQLPNLMLLQILPGMNALLFRFHWFSHQPFSIRKGAKELPHCQEQRYLFHQANPYT